MGNKGTVKKQENVNFVKVMGISGSPRKEGSASEKMLVMLLNYVNSYGADSELVKLREKNILFCEGCYSETRKGEKCAYPCIHDGLDDTMEILEKIIHADALVFSSPNYWGSVNARIHALKEKMTCVENNKDDIRKKIGREPFLGKFAALIISQEGDGASLAQAQMTNALIHMGFGFLPWSMIFKPAILDRKLVRIGMKILGEEKMSWVDGTIRLAARNLVLHAQATKELAYNDYKGSEIRC